MKVYQHIQILLLFIFGSISVSAQYFNNATKIYFSYGEIVNLNPSTYKIKGVSVVSLEGNFTQSTSYSLGIEHLYKEELTIGSEFGRFTIEGWKSSLTDEYNFTSINGYHINPYLSYHNKFGLDKLNNLLNYGVRIKMINQIEVLDKPGLISSHEINSTYYSAGIGLGVFASYRVSRRIEIFADSEFQSIYKFSSYNSFIINTKFSLGLKFIFERIFDYE